MPDLPDAGGLLGCAGPLPDITVPEDAIEAAMEWDARDGCLLPDRHWFAGMLAAAMPALRRHDADKLASWEATAAELRRQLAGTNALLATARAQRQAVLALCDKWTSGYLAHDPGFIRAVRAALGVTRDEATPCQHPATHSPGPKSGRHALTGLPSG